MKKKTIKTVDEYIAVQPANVREKLERLRLTIKKAAPKAEEEISYMMLAYKFHGVLVYFGAYQNHIGFYPTGSGISAFKKELSVYEGSKGTVRFPIDKPLPLTLIKKIVRFRLKENEQKQLLKKKK
ncbi:MAG: iron chaperone [Cyclobacteriaceae bacterium]